MVLMAARLREEGDLELFQPPVVRPVSIHSPLKRATRFRGQHAHNADRFDPRPREEGDTRLPQRWSRANVSIHAPVKRATLCRKKRTIWLWGFDPRPREEGDASIIGNYDNQKMFRSTPP